MKMILLGSCTLMMAATSAGAAQDAMSSNSMAAMTAPAAMTKGSMASDMATAHKTKKHHSSHAAKAKAGVKKSGKDSMSSDKMSQ
jgi:hypothetical protein